MRRMREFESDQGRLQIAEIANGKCIVGYLSTEPDAKWQHWGLGEGGFDATIRRFEACSTFNPDASPPLFRGKDLI